MGKSTSVGGQAVLEGVMMRGKNGIATAVRKTNEEIVVNKEDYTPYTKKIFLFSTNNKRLCISYRIFSNRHKNFKLFCIIF